VWLPWWYLLFFGELAEKSRGSPVAVAVVPAVGVLVPAAVAVLAPPAVPHTKMRVNSILPLSGSVD